jgi:hypothetical protein
MFMMVSSLGSVTVVPTLASNGRRHVGLRGQPFRFADCTLTYCRTDLLSLRSTKVKCRVLPDFWQSSRQRCKLRGSRGGVSTRACRWRMFVYQQSQLNDCHSTIAVVSSQHHIDHLQHARPRVLANVATTRRPLNVGLLNAQSLNNNSAAGSSCIVDNQLYLLAVVESWRESSANPSVIASTPPGYYVCGRPRPHLA